MARILIIDDDPQMRPTLRRILESAGHMVLEATNGAEGLAAFKSHTPDVVVTDIIMPEKEGIETILALRRLAPNLGIIAVSGGGLAGNADFLTIAEKLGADLSLQKPIRAVDLIAAVKRIAPAGQTPTAASGAAETAPKEAAGLNRTPLR